MVNREYSQHVEVEILQKSGVRHPFGFRLFHLLAVGPFGDLACLLCGPIDKSLLKLGALSRFKALGTYFQIAHKDLFKMPGTLRHS